MSHETERVWVVVTIETLYKTLKGEVANLEFIKLYSSKFVVKLQLKFITLSVVHLFTGGHYIFVTDAE